MDQAMQNGSTKARAWSDHMTGCTVAAKEQVKQCLINKGSLSELTSELDKSTFSAKISTVALQTLSTVGNTLLFLGIAKGIELAAKKFNEFIHAAEITREKSIELTNSWVSENDSINDSIGKYEVLKEKLNDTSLSASEVKNVKEDLLDVQKELIDKYGQETLGIDLVNGKYDEQIAKLKELSRQKAQDYVAENYSNIQEDKKYVNEKINLNKSLGFGGSQARPDDYSGSGFDLGKYLKRYDKLNAKVTEPSGQYGLEGTVNLITNGTREEVYDQLSQLFNDLSNDFGESNKDVNKFKKTLSGIIQDSFDTEQIEKSKNNIKKYAEAEILSKNETRKLYDDAIIAVDKYNDALSSGNDIEDAKKNLDDIKSKVESTTSDISGAEYVFNDIYSQVNSSAEKSYELSNKFNTDTSIREYAEQLKGLSNDDLLKIDFEDNVEQSGEKAFSALMNIIGLSKNEIQLLIDKLIELGYVQNSTLKDENTSSTPKTFQESWNSLGTTGDDDSRQATQEAKDQLLELAEAGKLTAEELQNSPAGKTIMEQTKLSAEEATEAVNKLADRTSQLSTMKSGIQSISNILTQKKEYKNSKKTENKGISPDVLAGVDDGIKGMDSWKHFEETLGNGKKSIEECQQAANNLATEWINSNNFLSGLNKTSKDYYISALQGMGIANAEDIVLSQLIAKGEEVTIGKLSLKEAMDKVRNAEGSSAEETRQNIACLQQEMGWTNNVANALEILYIKENILNNNSLGADTRVQELKKWAKALLGTAAAAEILEEADKAASNASTTGSDTLARQKAYNQTYEEKFKEKLGELGLDNIFDTSEQKKPKSPAEPNTTPDTTPKETKQSFDWLERRISVLTSKLDLLKAKLENVFSVQGKNSLINEEIKKTNTLINTYKKQAKIYKAQANKSAKSDKTASGDDKAKLTGKKGEKLKKQIQTGQIKGKKKQWIQEYGEKTANAIEEYQNYWDKYQTAQKNRQDAIKNKRELKIQKHQSWVDYYDSAGSSYDARIDTAATAKTKNKLEKEKLGYIKKSYNQQIKIAKLEGDSVKAATLLAQKWKEIADTRERIFQNQLDENADKRDYNNAAYENADNAGKKSLIQGNIDTYNSDKDAYADNVNSAQKTVKEANNDVSQKAKAVTSQMKKEGLNQSTMKEIQSYLSRGEKIPDKHLNGTQVMLPKLYKKLVEYNNAIDAAGIADEALEMAQKNQQKGMEETDTAIREEKSKSIQIDIDSANNQYDRLTAEYANLTTADAKNKNIDAQWLQQYEIHNKTIEQLKNDITDPKELENALAKEEAEWLSTWREMAVQQLQNLSDEESAQYELNQQLENNADSAKEKNKYEAESRKHLKSQYDYEIQIAKENGDLVEQERLRLEREQKIEESYQRQIDNIREEYDLIIGLNDARKSTIDARIAALQANGYGVGTELYQIQMTLDQDSYEKSLEEIKRISAEMPNLTGDALKQAEIELEAEKQKAWEFQKNLGELQQTINDINLSKLERIGTMLGYYAEKLEYIQDILSHSDFTLSAKEGGGMTMEGLADIAVTFSQIANNQEQIDNLYAQIAEKRRQLEESNVENGDQITEEIATLTQQAHDLEKANYDFGESIKTMVIDSLNSLSDALDENISKYKDALQAQKDLYDYRRKVSDQLKSIASLEKQLAALQGSDTEEARARIQKLQIQLEDEQQNLKDMEYDKYIQDQEELLDKVSEDFQDFIANVASMSVSDICKAMSTVVSDNLSDIGTTIEGAFAKSSKIGKLASSIDGLSEMIDKLDFSGNVTIETDEKGNIHFGYTDEKGDKTEVIINNSDQPGTVIGMTKNGKPVSLPGKEVTNTGDTNDGATSTQHKNNITGPKQKMAGELDKKNKNLRDAVNYFIVYADSYIDNGSGRMSWDPLNQYIYPKYDKMLSPYQEDLLLKEFDIDGDSSDRSALLKALNKIKELGFSQGGIASSLNRIALANGDDGWATLKRGESVLTPAQTEQFQKLIENLVPLNTVANSIASLPANPVSAHHSPAASNTTVRNVDIHLDGSHVMDADSFIQTLHNPRVLREVSSGVSSQLNSVMSNKLGNF